MKSIYYQSPTSRSFPSVMPPRGKKKEAAGGILCNFLRLPEIAHQLARRTSRIKDMGRARLRSRKQNKNKLAKWCTACTSWRVAGGGVPDQRRTLTGSPWAEIFPWFPWFPKPHVLLHSWATSPKGPEGPWSLSRGKTCIKYNSSPPPASRLGGALN